MDADLEAGRSTPLYPYAWGSQTLYSTPADYARFLALLMDGGMAGGKRLLSNEAIGRILTPVSPMKAVGNDGPYPCGNDRLNRTHPDRLNRTHLGLQDSRLGQGRQVRFTPTFDSSWLS